MGNCVRTSKKRVDPEEEIEQEERKGSGEGKVKGAGIKVKIVLTKEELEVLLVQLESEKGTKRLEDLLEELEKGRLSVKAHAWRPSLESIIEDTEGLELDRSS